MCRDTTHLSIEKCSQFELEHPHWTLAIVHDRLFHMIFCDVDMLDDIWMILITTSIKWYYFSTTI